MADRLLRGILVEIPLGDVRHMRCAMNEDPVPGPIFRGPAPSYVLVPFLARAKHGIDVVNHPSVVEEQVADKLPNCELRTTILARHVSRQDGWHPGQP